MKTAKQLKITDAEYDRLIAIRDLLRAGALEHHPNRNDAAKGMTFNMDVTADQQSCGSVCCIGGWVYAMNTGTTEEREDGMVVYKYDVDAASDYVWDASGGRLGRLFFPNEDPSVGGYDIRYNSITPAQAAQAIDNYLTTGTPKWGKILDLNEQVYLWADKDEYED